MKNNDYTLESTVRSGYAYVIANASKLIALLALVVAALVSFTDVGFGGFGSAELTTTLAVMLIASYVIYFSLEDSGERLGEESEEYSGALASYKKALANIHPSSVGALREYCKRYASSELKYRREGYLAENGITPEEYEKRRENSPRERRVRRVMRRAEAMKPMHLCPSVLLSGERVRKKGELESPKRERRIATLCRLLPSTLSTLFTVSVILTAKDGLTASAVIESVLKLSALPIIGYKGYRAGYEHARYARSGFLEAKTRILEGFLSEKKESVIPL